MKSVNVRRSSSSSLVVEFAPTELDHQKRSRIPDALKLYFVGPSQAFAHSIDGAEFFAFSGGILDGRRLVGAHLHPASAEQ